MRAISTYSHQIDTYSQISSITHQSIVREIFTSSDPISNKEKPIETVEFNSGFSLTEKKAD